MFTRPFPSTSARMMEQYENGSLPSAIFSASVYPLHVVSSLHCRSTTVAHAEKADVPLPCSAAVPMTTPPAGTSWLNNWVKVALPLPSVVMPTEPMSEAVAPVVSQVASE